MNGRLKSLEVVTSFPIPEEHGSVVGSRHQDAVGIGSHAVDNGIVPGQILEAKKLFVATVKRKETVTASFQKCLAGIHQCML